MISSFKEKKIKINFANLYDYFTGKSVFHRTSINEYRASTRCLARARNAQTVPTSTETGQ